MEDLLISLGINIASSALYDFVKSKIVAGTTKDVLIDELNNFLNVDGQSLKAEKIISFMAEHGQITVNNTSIYSGQTISMGSRGSGQFIFGNNSISTTPNTMIQAGPGSFIVANGNARVVQDEGGGSISLSV